MYVALKDRPEIESVDFDGGYMLCTVKDEYIQQADSRRTLTQEEADIMLAKHILWLNDAGGIQADFSNCLVRGLNLAHKNMMNVAMDNARFVNTDLQGAELNFPLPMTHGLKTVTSKMSSPKNANSKTRSFQGARCRAAFILTAI